MTSQAGLVRHAAGMPDAGAGRRRKIILGWVVALALGLGAPASIAASAMADELAGESESSTAESETTSASASETTESTAESTDESTAGSEEETTDSGEDSTGSTEDATGTAGSDGETDDGQDAGGDSAASEDDSTGGDSSGEDGTGEETSTDGSDGSTEDASGTAEGGSDGTSGSESTDESTTEEQNSEEDAASEPELAAANEISPLALELDCDAWPVGTPAGFEIDGNLCANPGSSTGLDWSTVGGQPVYTDPYGNSDPTQFTQGADETNWPWSAGQTGGSGSGQGGKEDVGNVYAFSTTSGGDVFAFLGFEREATNGSVAYRVELNQLPGGPSPDRSVGDLRLTIDQTGNETISLVGADTWNGTSWDSLGSLGGFTGQVNQDTTFNLADDELDAGAFAEVAINLTTLFGEAGCSGEYGTLNVRSSASPSPTAALKDWIPAISLNVPSTCASVQVDKTWVIDGQSYDDGAQPFGDATLELTGQDAPEFGETYTEHSDTTDYEAGDVITIGEQVTGLPPGCTNVPSGDLGDHSLSTGLNTYTVTNTVTCTYLTLVKEVVGEADPTEWTLTADGPTPVSGVSGSDAVTQAHVAPGEYTIGETGGPEGYQQTDLVCTPNEVDGEAVMVNAGDAVTCTITNTAEVGLQVLKTWVVDGEQFADGDQPVGEAQLTLDGADADFGTVYDGYVVGSQVVVAEEVSGLPEACDLVTTIDGEETASVDHTITLTPDPNVLEVVNTVTCTQTITLIKDVEFGSALPSEWTLTAVGPEDHTVTGASGSPEVTDQPVVADEPYALSESDGPITYVQSGEWVCEDAEQQVVEVVNGEVTVAYGASVTCTVTNTTAMITILKHIDDGSTDVLSPEDWTLVATPDCGIAELPVVEVTGAETESADNTAEILPDCSYLLTEELAEGSPIAYREVALQVWDPDAAEWVTVADNAVSVEQGEHGIYRFVNDAPPAVNLPLTGGTSTDAVTFAGLTFLVMAAGLVFYQWHRRREAGVRS
ncbi:LPXTG cell wall anchor domain-containing protein [Ruania alkalisoli]|uniref:LPXTG cell wall anchor domain-containing protein n=1 Tax=Ruania alkalisoli TaxID=2779775 RepID=A0A7M1SXH5_9MICO|nr:LPXTG cell wall anchor domain-containing protein [Ruania alkalisoli]QOR71664.1 LPXTG cell wall anchor domain-containing protein [Ruania alkalisoli]